MGRRGCIWPAGGSSTGPRPSPRLTGSVPHDRPWTAEYLREAISVYSQSLPRSYQQNMADLFSGAAEAMAARSVPAELAEDWLIVTEYMTQAGIAIDRWLAAQKPESPAEEIPPPEIDDHTPSVAAGWAHPITLLPTSVSTTSSA